MNTKEASSTFEVVARLEQHKDLVLDMDWSSDGTTLASVSRDRRICLWDTENYWDLCTFRDPRIKPACVSWRPESSRYIATGAFNHTVQIYDVQNERLIDSLYGPSGPVLSIHWYASGSQGEFLAAGSQDSNIYVWNLAKRDLANGRIGSPMRLPGHWSGVYSLAVSPDYRYLASGTEDGTIGLWRHGASHRDLRVSLNAHRDCVRTLAWSPQGKLVSGGADGRIYLWDHENYQPEKVIDVHKKQVLCIRFSSDGNLLASKSLDGTVRLWRCDEFEQVASFQERSLRLSGGLALHPSKPILATCDADTHSIVLRKFDSKRLLSKGSRIRTRFYRNAKVVLAGDHGVGKTGLSLVLSGRDYQPTDSTPSRVVRRFDRREEELPGGKNETRESYLWDLAGQPYYCIIHQLCLNEVCLALLVVDRQKEWSQSVKSVRRWDRALSQIKGLMQGRLLMKRILVVAREDIPSVDIDGEAFERELQSLKDELDISEHFLTSALEGWQIEPLRRAIDRAIEWDKLPQVKSTELFQELASFLVSEREQGRQLTTVEDLFRSLSRSSPKLLKGITALEEFRTCLKRLENRDIVRMLRFGDFVLLQPEMLDAYASDLILAASNPHGAVLEQDAYGGNFEMRNRNRILNPQLEQILLIATVRELLHHDIAFKATAGERAYLVFPSQSNRSSTEGDRLPIAGATYSFDGAVEEIYATLVVRLANSDFFSQHDLWRNSARFEFKKGRFDVSLSQSDAGSGQLELHFDPSVDPMARSLCEDYVASHLEHRAIQHRDSRSALEKPRSKKHATKLDQIDQTADKVRERNTTEAALEGKKRVKHYDVFFCYSRIDKENVRAIGSKLSDRGIRPFIDETSILPGEKWTTAVDEQLENLRAAVVFLGGGGMTDWATIEAEALIEKAKLKDRPLIPVFLPSCARDFEMPWIFTGRTPVDFRKLMPEPIDELIRGIRGWDDS